MARLLGIPLVVHEQNALAGMTNRWLSCLADRVLEAFPGSFPPLRRALAIGNPVRTSIATLPEPAQRFAGRTGSPRLLVVGGSQGALALNQLVPAALELIPVAQRPEVWHQAGGTLQTITAEAYAAAGVAVKLQPFIEEMAAAYGWADLVLCRAGAITVAELAAAGVGAVLVPFPYAVDDHQTANARFLEKSGAALIAPQAELKPASLAALLQTLLSDRAKLLSMAQAARNLAKADAAAQVASICLEQAQGATRLRAQGKR